MTNDLPAGYRLRLFLALWCAGAIGVGAIVITFVPQIVATEDLPVPIWVVSISSFIQSGMLLALAVWVWVGISVSAILFGAGHLPAVSAVVDVMDAPLVAEIVGMNTIFGVLFGWLYWRYGLESAILAHIMTHMVNSVIG